MIQHDSEHRTWFQNYQDLSEHHNRQIARHGQGMKFWRRVITSVIGLTALFHTAWAVANVDELMLWIDYLL